MDLNKIKYKFLTTNDLENFEKFILKTNTADDKIWEFIKDNFKKAHKEFVVGCAFLYDEIVAIVVGYTFNVIWNKNNVFPFWILGRMHSIIPIPSIKDRDKLLSLLTNHFENLGFHSCFAVTKISNKINYKNVDCFLKRYTKKAFKADRYNCSVERIFNSDNFDYQNLNICYKQIVHKYCEENKSILIIRYDLKNKFKQC
jgi:hypothetical protein